MAGPTTQPPTRPAEADREVACACDAAPSIAAHFDDKLRRTGAEGPPSLHVTTRALLELLGDPKGRTLLELGCGRGGLLLEELRAGAAGVTGIDLSAASVEVARRRVEEAGCGERADFEVGDGAALPLGPHDWVVLDRVVCCYPDARALLANAIPSAVDGFAFSAPESRGWRGPLARLTRALDDRWDEFRGRGCKSFVHDLDRIERTLAAAGFERRGRTHRGLWYVGVFERRTGR